MAKNKHKKSIPHARPREATALHRLKHAMTRGTLYRDVVLEARSRLKSANRWSKQHEGGFVLQMTVANFFIVDVLQLTEKEGIIARQLRDEDVFNKEVESMMNKMAPVVLPGINAPMKHSDIPPSKFDRRIIIP